MQEHQDGNYKIVARSLMYLNSVDQQCARVGAKTNVGSLLENLPRMENAINTLIMSVAAAVKIEKQNQWS